MEKVSKLCNKTEPENCQIAVKYGGVEASIQAYYALLTYRMSWGSLAFKVLHSLIAGDSKVLMSVLHKHHPRGVSVVLFWFVDDQSLCLKFFVLSQHSLLLSLS